MEGYKARQAKKVIMFGLHYGMSGKSQFMKAYIEEFAAVANSMAVARNTGIGYISLEHQDYTALEIRALSHFHDETVITYKPYEQRKHSRNERGRHWDKKRREPVRAVHKTAQQVLDEDFKNNPPEAAHMHKMGKVESPQWQRKTIPCQIVEAGGMISLTKQSWWDTPPKFWS